MKCRKKRVKVRQDGECSTSDGVGKTKRMKAGPQ